MCAVSKGLLETLVALCAICSTSLFLVVLSVLALFFHAVKQDAIFMCLCLVYLHVFSGAAVHRALRAAVKIYKL